MSLHLSGHRLQRGEVSCLSVCVPIITCMSTTSKVEACVIWTFVIHGELHQRLDHTRWISLLLNHLSTNIYLFFCIKHNEILEFFFYVKFEPEDKIIMLYECGGNWKLV